MQLCPNKMDLNRWLNGEVSEPALTETNNHVAACTKCQKTIEKLESDPELTSQELPEEAKTRYGEIFGLFHKYSIDGFETVRKIGEGGMGRINLVEDEKGNLYCAKFMNNKVRHNPDAVKQFLKEAKHMKELSHNHVVPVLEIGGSVEDESTEPYFLMPYYENGSLERITDNGPLAKDTILKIAEQIAGALAYVHDEGIIHRDSKPKNILMDKDGNAHLADFGLVRSLYNDSMLKPGDRHPVGSLAYMSPDVAAGKAEDTRCDIYAFGAVLYQMLTGKRPYAEVDGYDEILLAIGNRPPQPIRELNPKADKDLITVAEGAMAREHGDRYANMQYVVKDLKRIAGGQSPLGPHAQTRASRVSRYERILLGSLAVCILLLIGFGISYWWPTVQPKVQPTPKKSPATVVKVDPNTELDRMEVSFFSDFKNDPNLPKKLIGEYNRNNKFLKERGIKIRGKLKKSAIRMKFHLSSPAYYQLLAFNPDKSIVFCLPKKGLKLQSPKKSDEYPVSGMHFFTEGRGLYAFVLVVTDRPVDLKRHQDDLQNRWQGNQDTKNENVYFHDGEHLDWVQKQAGQEKIQLGSLEQFDSVCMFLKEREGVIDLRGYALSVVEEMQLEECEFKLPQTPAWKQSPKLTDKVRGYTLNDLYALYETAAIPKPKPNIEMMICYVQSMLEIHKKSQSEYHWQVKDYEYQLQTLEDLQNGKKYVEWLQLMSTLDEANKQWNAKKYDSAFELFKNGLEKGNKFFPGKYHPVLAKIRFYMGMCLWEKSKPDKAQAIDHIRLSIDELRQFYSDYHPVHIRMNVCLADFYRNINIERLALSRYKEAIEISSHIYHPNHTITKLIKIKQKKELNGPEPGIFRIPVTVTPFHENFFRDHNIVPVVKEVNDEHLRNIPLIPKLNEK